MNDELRKPRGGGRQAYVAAGYRAGCLGQPNRPAAGKFMREPWQRTAYREGWAEGNARREQALADEADL